MAAGLPQRAFPHFPSRRPPSVLQGPAVFLGTLVPLLSTAPLRRHLHNKPMPLSEPLEWMWTETDKASCSTFPTSFRGCQALRWGQVRSRPTGAAAWQEGCLLWFGCRRPRGTRQRGCFQEASVRKGKTEEGPSECPWMDDKRGSDGTSHAKVGSRWLLSAHPAWSHRLPVPGSHLPGVQDRLPCCPFFGH